MKNVLLLLLTLNCLGCSIKDTNVVSFRYVSGTFADSLNLNLNRNKNDYHYTLQSEDVHIISFTESPPLLTYMDVKCSLVETRTFEMDGNPIQVHKFLYDEIGAVDEETYIYFSKNHGLIALRSKFWNTHTILQNNNHKLIDALTQDTTDFFRVSRIYK